MNVLGIQSRHGGRDLKRPGLHHPTIAPYGVYPCGDGGMILFSIQNEREWRVSAQMCWMMRIWQEDRLAGNTNRVANRSQLDARIIAAFAKHSREEQPIS